MERRHAALGQPVGDDLGDVGVRKITDLRAVRDVGSSFGAATVKPMTTGTGRTIGAFADIGRGGFRMIRRYATLTLQAAAGKDGGESHERGRDWSLGRNAHEDLSQ